MRRKPLVFVVTLSLLACAATLALGATSYFRELKMARYSRAYDGDALHTLQASLQCGRVVLARAVWGRGGDKKTEYEFHSLASDATGDWDVDSRWMGFGWLSEKNPPDTVDSFLQVVSVPVWPIAACLGAIAFVGGRGLVRRRSGCCAACGYDLRATPHRCPECGVSPIAA